MRNRRLLSLAAILAAAALTALLLLCAGATSAQPPPVQPCSPIVTAPDRMIWDGVGINPGDDMYPDVAYNSQDDEYLVVFEWPDASGRDIVSIRVDANGQAAISPTIVTTSTVYTDTHPAVAYNPTNNTYLVVFERSPGSQGKKDIVRVVLNASGTVSGTSYIVAGWNSDQGNPDVAYSTVDDRYLVVWEANLLAWTNGPDIYGAILDSSGSVLGGQSVTGLDAPGEQTYPAVAANAANGRWLVTWQDSRNSGTTGNDIYGQQMRVSGSTLSISGTQVAIGTIPGWAGQPDVAWGQTGSGDGTFLTAWSESSILVGQRVLADSALAGDVITISNYASSKSVPAAAFAAPDRAWWVVWEDNRDYG